MTLPRRAILVTIGILAAAAPGAYAQAQGPTLAIVNAKVFTGVPAAPWAEALTVDGQRIGVVGTTAAIRAIVTPSTRVIDAAGRVVIPGINDAHVHLGARPPGVDLEGRRSSSRTRRSTTSCSA